MIFSWPRPRTHVHEEESAIEQGDGEQVGAARGEGFAPALFRLTFQDSEEDTGVRDHDDHKSEDLYEG